jgi:hypothetical protein
VFTIVADPDTRRLWWAFRSWGPASDSLAVADEFEASHIAYSSPEELLVFSSSNAELLIGVGTTYYTTPESIPGVVRAAFDSRATGLSSSGFGAGAYHYYEKAHSDRIGGPTQ